MFTNKLGYARAEENHSCTASLIAFWAVFLVGCACSVGAANQYCRWRFGHYPDEYWGKLSLLGLLGYCIFTGWVCGKLIPRSHLGCWGAGLLGLGVGLGSFAAQLAAPRLLGWLPL